VTKLGSAILAFALAAASCRPAADPGLYQGYVEGEYVYVACPAAGALETLSVSRGARVKAGDPLFAVENSTQVAARDEAARRVAQAKAELEDARKGSRPSEIDSLAAQLGQAKSSLELSTRERERQEGLATQGATSVQDLDRARAAMELDKNRVAQIEADLATAKLGRREDQVAAAEANLRATEADLAKVDWDLFQMKQAARQDAVVFDTLFRPGEWVPAGKPVVALLPPGFVKVRAFVPQAEVSRIQLGAAMTVAIDGLPQPLQGKVSFISPKVEFTPPVIYGRESRGKLVVMIEIVFEAATAATLHPGQPADVRATP
jgi:HlyD family secretion protein